MDKLLRIYLTDHLAGAHAGREVAKRCASSNEGNEVGEFLSAEFLPALERDLRSLEDVMARLGMSSSPWKNALGWAFEKVGRLKLNGQISGYSPLSRLVELEGLVMGVTGKKSLWVSLAETSRSDARLSELDLDALIAAADAQLEGLERHRRWAAHRAFMEARPEDS